MKIGIYGGSFNPIHHGHINVAKYAIKELKLNKLYFVPSFKTPFKSRTKYAKAKSRVDMIDLVKPTKTEVSMFEVNKKGISYTIDTIKYFRKKFPNDKLYLIIGTDNLYKLHKWKEIKKIVKEAKIIVFRRTGNFSKKNINKYECTLLDNKIWNYSSTYARKGVFKDLDVKVVEYIGKKQLYLIDIIVKMLSVKRYKHCLATADFATKLAKKHNVNVNKALVSSLLHDITKEWSDKDNKDFLLSKGFDPTGTPELIWHQWSGAIWVDEVYKIKDKEVKEAISKHSNADAVPVEELSQLTKVVYIADKLCKGRKYKNIQQHRELVFENLDKGFEIVSKQSKQFIFDKYGKCVYYKLKKCKKTYK